MIREIAEIEKLVSLTNFAEWNNIICTLNVSIFGPKKFAFVDSVLGVKIQNLKVDFKTGSTWRRFGQLTLIMNIYDLFIRLR